MGLNRGVALFGAGVVAGASLLVSVAGCRHGGGVAGRTPSSEGQIAPAEAAKAVPVSTKPVSSVPPNEMGRVPVLEYHVIGSKEDRWERTPANFRKDLELLYKNGFRAVSLHDYVTGNINLPKGASPVVFTFDDATPGQFRYLEQDGKVVTDPDCAVGMLEEFNRKHPDFGLHATFYVLPDSAFGQPKYAKQKLQYLISHGMEVGNHTWSHTPLRKLTDAKVQEELGRPVQFFHGALPGYTVTSLALPNGIWPKNKTLAHSGAWSGVRYQNQSIMLVGSAPAPSPYSKKFNPLNLPRVQVTDSLSAREQAFTFDAQWKSLMKPGRRYVSDGDPKTITVPAKDQADVDPAKAGDKQVKAD